MTQKEISVTKIANEWYCPVDEIEGMIKHPKGAFDNMLDFLFHLRGAKKNEIIEIDGAKYVKLDKEWWTCLNDISKNKDDVELKHFIDTINIQEEQANANN